MYLWQRLAPPKWWAANEVTLRAKFDTDVAVVERAGRKQLIIEIACRSRDQANCLRREFGGRVIRLGHGWLKQFTRTTRTKPLRIGKRLLVTNVGRASAPRLRGRHQSSRHQGRSHIIIPAGAAFGTGQHPTTAMSLRLLEELTRSWNSSWSMVDLGTGSGIFALAANRLGAQRVIAIDNDPVAISTAKGNAAINRISDVQFKVADVLRWQLPKEIDLVTANLFSELLIRVAPKLKLVSWLIVSGIMREQEKVVCTALQQNGFALKTIRRRGKWIAALASRELKERRFRNRRTSW